MNENKHDLLNPLESWRILIPSSYGLNGIPNRAYNSVLRFVLQEAIQKL
jgi:hypothetical protein